MIVRYKSKVSKTDCRSHLNLNLQLGDIKGEVLTSIWVQSYLPCWYIYSTFGNQLCSYYNLNFQLGDFIGNQSGFCLTYLAPISIQHFVASFHLSLIVRNLYGMETSYLKLIGYSYVPHADQTLIFLLSSYCYLKLKFRKIVNAPPLRGVARVFKACRGTVFVRSDITIPVGLEPI